ncbi:MAG: amidohydrolase family protein [Leucobacter sp.]
MQSEKNDADETRVLIRNGKAFVDVDRTSGPLSIWVSGGNIVEVCQPENEREQRAAAEGVSEIDAKDGAVLPGLIDAHAHVGLLSFDQQVHIPPASQAAMMFHNLSSSLDQGFTTLRDLGGVDGGLVEAIEVGLIEGPRLLPSAAIMSRTAVHGDVRPRFAHVTDNVQIGLNLFHPFVICDGVEQVTRTAREQFRAGATQLKVHATGGQLSEGDPLECSQFSPAELEAFVAVAEDRYSYVAAQPRLV